MKKFFFLIALVAISAFNVLAQDASITGRVTYGKSSPLHDASVQVVQTRQMVRTDENGTYTLTGVAPGRYTILVHIEGFADATRTVTVAPGANLTMDFELKIATLKEEVTVTASGTEQTVFDSFQTVNSVGSTRITEKASTSIGEVLETETGVAKRSFGPGSSRPIIRGFDGDRVLVLQDGVRNGSVGS